ncbi:uncharacterized protein LOC118434464 [Folsomia candida]|uniref:uncharacterized protein LOC118434464 n=1 Tax=Folsomia candida TaxID=158441 RepID=UPI001604BCB7|nr:uncharacterized protein LOC118434464 [Folsomia candida]
MVLNIYNSRSIVLFDIIGSIVIGGLVIFAWLSVDNPIQYVHHSSNVIGAADGNTSYFGEGRESERRKGLEGCIITWCLTILLGLCGWRIVSAVILTFAIRQKSLNLLQYWIGYKSLVLVMSIFLLISALTSKPVIPSAVASFILDMTTCYFVRILIPELALISKGSVQ